MTCEHCHEEHQRRDLSEVAEDILDYLHAETLGPSEGALVLALSLGRLCEVFNVDVEEMIRLARGSHALSRTVSEAGPLPQRGSSWEN